MLRRLISTGLVFVLLLPNAAQGRDASPAPAASIVEIAIARQGPDLADRRALEIFFDRVMAEALDSDHIAGGVVAIVRDGETHFAKGYGFADLEAKQPVDPARTLFRVGSVAKLFVGTAIMQLVEQGRLDLDTDVNTYLTAFQIPASYPEAVTLRHLLTHSAGFEERIIGNDRKRTEDQLRPLADALPDLMPARVRPPGKVASYSNWGVTLAGHIVELVSGLSFADYVQRNIFGPLRMGRSTFREPVPANLREELAVGYLHKAGVYTPQEFEFVSDYGPAGAMSSTALDMAQFMIAHLHNGRLGKTRILSEDGAIEMHRRQFGSHPNLPGIAINFGISTLDGRLLLQHSGATMVFHANLMLLPREDVGLFVAFNSPGAADDRVVKAFLDRYFSLPESPMVASPKDSGVRSERYLGTYRSNRLAFTRLEKAMRFNELTVQDSGRGTLFLGDLLSDANNAEEGVELVEIGPDLFWNEDKDFRVAFSEDPSGKVANLFIGSSMPSFHRIAWYETIHVLGLTLLVSFIVFTSASILGVWALLQRGRHRVDEPRRALAARSALLGVCATGAVFACGFAVIVLTNADPFRYPTGTEIMLILPVMSAVLTAVAGGLVLLTWIRGYGTPWARVGNTVVVLTSVLYLLVLDMWNMLGWQL